VGFTIAKGLVRDRQRPFPNQRAPNGRYKLWICSFSGWEKSLLVTKGGARPLNDFIGDECQLFWPARTQ
jgi:hypothetical protein